mmetsp:Transcript_22328/g.56632  ORF Transcript_22328/g.56632 Transcript_22328/m.56632 type:complete len:103 (+) Transcript_22328:57-365(+)
MSVSASVIQFHRRSAAAGVPPHARTLRRPSLPPAPRAADVLPNLVALAVLRKRTILCSCSLLSRPRVFDPSASELHQQLITSTKGGEPEAESEAACCSRKLP